MQNDFINIDGKLPVKGAFEALFNIYALIESNEIDKVIFTADWHVPSHESFKLNGGQWPEHCVQLLRYLKDFYNDVVKSINLII